MKKTLLAIAVVATLGIVGYQVADAGPNGPGGYGMMGQGYGMMGAGSGPQGLDEQTLQAREKFFKETTELRKKMTAKRTELQAVMSGEKPDEKKAAKLSEELYDLREQMRAKALEGGITTAAGGYFCNGPYGAGGPGMGSGPRHHGWGW